MKLASQLYDEIGRGGYDSTFSYLYPGAETTACRERYQSLLTLFQKTFGDRSIILVSAPGRTEVGGNHTDHQHGNVLAAAVNLDIICAVSPNEDNAIRVQSVGYPMDTVELSDLSIQAQEIGKSSALIRGIAAWFADKGISPSGFDACTTSDVLGGSGLSSSAAFEVCMGTVMNLLWQGGKSPVEIAIAGQYAENNYFGKPCGLMDQMASSVGGFVQIDFDDTQNPVIRSVAFDLAAHGFSLCIVDTKGDHADLTDDYAAITVEMGRVAAFFDKQYLRQVNEADFMEKLAALRATAGDRAVLRALHFFRDDKLAVETASALESGDTERFLRNIIRSGRSSFACLQNVFSPSQPEHQGLSLALALSESILEGEGAWRVHGGGFAGTIQAFVPAHLLEAYRNEMNRVFGEGACHILSIRPVGAVEILPGKGAQ